MSNDSNILATQSGTWTVNQGGTWTVQQGTPPWSVSQSGVWTTRIVGNAGGILDAAGQNAGSPANELLTACQFNTSPTTVTSGNVTPVQCNNAGALNVAIVSGGGTGGTASSFGAAFPATGTAIGVKNGTNMVNLAADGSNNLLVDCAVGCGASGFADLGAFTLGASNINPIGGVFETSPAPVAPGQAAAVMITGNRAAFFNRRDSAGQEIGQSLPGSANVPERVVIAPALTVPTQTILQPTDQMGQPRAASMLTDGRLYLSLVPPNGAAQQTQTAIVVRNPDLGSTADTTYGGSGNATLNAIEKGIYAAVTSPIPAGTNNIGKVDILGNAGGVMDAAGQNASSPSNELLVGAQFNTTPTTIASGNVSPLQMDSAGNLLVNVKVGGGGGSSFADLAAFTLGTSTITNIGGVYSTTPAPVASGEAAAAMITGNRALFENRRDSSGQELGANLPGQVNAPVQVNQAATLPPYNKGNLYPTPVDPYGQPRTAAMLTDGKDYAQITAPFQVATAAMPGVIVSVSPNSPATVNGTVSVTQATSPWLDNLRNSAGQEIGSNLASANNIPLQVNPAPTLSTAVSPVPNKTASLAIGGVTVLPGPQDQTGATRTAPVITDGQHYANVVGATQSPQVTDPALEVAASPKPSLQCPFVLGINQTTNTQVVTNTGGKYLHICLWNPIASAAMNISLVEGTGATCATNTIGLWGGTSASVPVAANGGAALVSDRIILPMQRPGDNLCVLQGTGTVSGTLTYGVFNL